MIAALSLLLLAPPPVDTAGLAIRVVRFFRTETGQTQVAAFIQTPPLAGGSLTLRVVEAGGPTLWEQSWQRPLDLGAADLVDHLRFTVAPGDYAVEVAVRDSTGQVVGATQAPIMGFDGNPGVSDLLLAPLIRAAQAADSIPRADEYRRGGLVIEAPGIVRISMETPILHYYLEAYTPYGGQGMIGAVLFDSAGTAVREAPLAPVRLPSELGVLTGQLDLTGMLPGRYSLVTMVMIGERKLEREAGFAIEAAGIP